MNFIQMMHYAQYHYLIENKDFGENSSFSAKCSITGLMGASLIVLLHIFGFYTNTFLKSYWHIAIFLSLLIFVVVDYFSLTKKELENPENEIYRNRGRLYFNIIMYGPLCYLFYLMIKNIVQGGYNGLDN